MKRNIFIVLFTLTIALSNIVNVFGMDKGGKYNIFSSDNGKTEKIIEKCFTEQALHDSFEFADKRYIPDNYYTKPNVYAIVYHVSDTFLTELSRSDGYSIKETTIGDKPDIYIPVFSNIDDTERVIGHVNLYYSYSQNSYVYTIAVMNCISEEFLERTHTHFLENIYSENLIDSIAKDNSLGMVKNVVLVELPYPINDYDNKVLLLKTETGDYAYDLTNTANVEDVVGERLYNLDKYIDKRLDFEAKNIDRCNILRPGNMFAKVKTIITVITIALIAFIFVVVFLIFKYNNKKVTYERIE